MKHHRIHNFNAGPSALPLAVLEDIKASLIDYRGSGMSVMELSHRSAWFDEILGDTIARIRRLMGLSDDFEVLFIQGGASLQFAMIPMNFLGEGDSADYVDTGLWSSKAIAEARIQNKTIRVAASSQDRNYAYIPKDIAFDPKAAFVHLTSNNTVKGTQWHQFPDTGAVPIIVDMSSDILSRPMAMTGIGMIYAGVQKNMGPAGAALVVIRKDLLERIPGTLPTMLSYKTFAKNNSMFNTPPCFTIYVVQKVMAWLEENGGVDAMGQRNAEKAKTLYDLIDASRDFYASTADKDSRSLMNVTFRLPDEGLEKRFVDEALKQGMGGLKGHKSVGGCRASIYNATTLASVSALADFMRYFEEKHG
jgi:phosphoserine aminotransferase